ncbi:MAG: hypothetical protein J3K34DRAFT_423822 [Monoraphidium minutum]|nr:MAG: hypothetical protein J3K34DRAFT_423822 [Monoraphidium minutum]
MQTLLASLPSDHFQQPGFEAPAGGGGGAGDAAAQRRRRGGGILSLLRTDTFAVLLWAGRVLGEVVGWTQQVRLLTAVLMAYAAVAGLLPPGRGPLAPPPALALCFTQAAVVGAAALLLGRAAARRVAERDAAGGGGAATTAGGVQIPLRARQVDILSFIPGAREVLSGLSGYRALAAALSEGVAVYLLTCGLLSLAAKA